MERYSIELFVNDDGAQVARLILRMPTPVSISDVRPDCFNVHVDRQDEQGHTLMTNTDYFSGKIIPAKGYRTVLAAYPSDETGEPVRSGNCVTLELDVKDTHARAIIGSLSGSAFVNCVHRITQTAPIGALSGLVWDTLEATRCPQQDGWTHGRTGVLQYACYTPGAAGVRPLVIWLHGAGEGGQDPRIAYMGNNVVALSSEKIQSYFGGAYVLVPQCPTMWMDDGSHTYGHTGKSMYSNDLFSLIDEFVRTHPIDKTRIYVGGCSNGGFMTMRLLADHPRYFAAAYPMCEALYDDTITEQELQNIATTPVWLMHAMTDGVVNPEQTAHPTYKRLKAIGAPAHFTFIDDRPPFPMVNHGVWVPGLREEHNEDYDGSPVLVDGKPATRFQWLAAQRLK